MHRRLTAVALAAALMVITASSAGEAVKSGETVGVRI